MVLVVDDEATVRNVAALMLKEMGFEPVTADDGTKGVEMFRKYAGKIRAVLLDMTMPGMSGREVFEQVKKLRPDVPVLLSSGYDEMDATERFGGQGIAGFVKKPYQLSTLADKLREALKE